MSAAWEAPVLADEIAEAVAVALQGLGQGFDERLEAGASEERAGVIFPHLVLADVKAEPYRHFCLAPDVG